MHLGWAVATAAFLLCAACGVLTRRTARDRAALLSAWEALLARFRCVLTEARLPIPDALVRAAEGVGADSGGSDGVWADAERVSGGSDGVWADAESTADELRERQPEDAHGASWGSSGDSPRGSAPFCSGYGTRSASALPARIVREMAAMLRASPTTTLGEAYARASGGRQEALLSGDAAAALRACFTAAGRGALPLREQALLSCERQIRTARAQAEDESRRSSRLSVRLSLLLGAGLFVLLI